jgi:molybdopterin/thiamine biosynthesis adenylyltransferase
MKRNLRIKRYYHLLQRDTVVDFIKTLDEGPKLPAGDFFNGFLETIQNFSDEDAILEQLSAKFGVPHPYARQFLDQLLALGILEYYHEGIPPELNRYQRQLLFFDSVEPSLHFEDNIARQKKLQDKHVLVLGVGGIGNFIAMALVAAGVGKLSLADNDVVEETNLNRQLLFDSSALGRSKAIAAAERLQVLNPECSIQPYQCMVRSQSELAHLIKEVGMPDYLVLSADQPVELVLWASALCPQYRFKYIKCGYMAYQGLIGPLLGPATRPYEALYQSWSETINAQSESIQLQNQIHQAPSLAAGNAILANIAALELIKDMTELIPSVLLENRLVFNLKTMELYYG